MNKKKTIHKNYLFFFDVEPRERSRVYDWRIKPGCRYEVVANVGDYYIVWANGTDVIIPKAGLGEYYNIETKEECYDTYYD